VGRRPDLPTRRALALGLPLIPFLARFVPPGVAPGLAGQAGSAPRANPPKTDADPRGTASAPSRTLSATVILLRHAEKSAAGDPKDPSLSEVGQKRARALAGLLAKAKATHLFASEFHRTQETLAPLAEATKLAVVVVPGAKLPDLAAKILDLAAGSVAVVAGHTNTLPGLAVLLGAELDGLEKTPQGPLLPDADYGRLFVLTPRADVPERAAVLELAYGA
jgi:phosphohistidine phosphatase SixA